MKKYEANILFVLGQLKKLQPNADFGHLTLFGHSNGGDVATYCSKQHPELVPKVAIISNGNTVKNTEYSFLANVLAARVIWLPAFSKTFAGF